MLNPDPVFRWTADQLIAKYIALRDHRKVITDRHKNELAPIDMAMEAIEGEAGRMMEHLKTTLSTDSGSCFWVASTKYTVSDPVAWRTWVISTQNWDCTTNHVSKDGIEAVLEKTPADPETGIKPLPPGLSSDYVVKVQFRK